MEERHREDSKSSSVRVLALAFSISPVSSVDGERVTQRMESEAEVKKMWLPQPHVSLKRRGGGWWG